MDAVIVVTALAVAGVLALTPRLRASRSWKATVTPLSSIMGSGFLVSAPLLAGEAGVYSPLAMAGLLLVAYGIGSLIRFNIRYAEPELEDTDDHREHRLHRGHHARTQAHWQSHEPGHAPESTQRTEPRQQTEPSEELEGIERRVARPIEQLSHIVLTGAYVISVTYYLQLLSAFVLDRFGVHNLTASRLTTTSILAIMTAIGSLWGLKALEKLEVYAVSLNLGMIAALLVGLALHDGYLATRGQLALPPLSGDRDLPHATRVIMGLLIVVQGFETSRFLGSEHPARERALTMRRAQLIASAIYLVFVSLMLPLFDGRTLSADVTAIVSLVAPVAVVLPMLIVIAAVGSQFSAAVADDAGCAGLTRTLFSERLSSRWAYLSIGLATIGLTWLSDVLAIISYASRAFALFYALQCAVAVVTAYVRRDADGRIRVLALGTALALVSLGVAVLGVPAE